MVDDERWGIEEGINGVVVFVEDGDAIQSGAVIDADDGAIAVSLAFSGDSEGVNLDDNVASLPRPGRGVEGVSLAENAAIGGEDLGEEDGVGCV